jgi:hypothetical protein
MVLWSRVGHLGTNPRAATFARKLKKVFKTCVHGIYFFFRALFLKKSGKVARLEERNPLTCNDACAKRTK